MDGDFQFGSKGPAVLLVVDGAALHGRKQEVLAFFEQGAEHVRDTPGMNVRLHWDGEDPNRFRLLFEYETEQAFEAHDIRTRADPGFLEYRSRLTELLVGPPDVSVWRESSRQISDDLVRAYWGLVDAREWHGLRAILAPDVVLEWPAFNERIVGADNVVGVNIAAPENWVATVLWVVASGDHVSSATEVRLPRGDVSVLTTLWTVEGHRIKHATEFWCSCGAVTPPSWHKPYVETINP